MVRVSTRARIKVRLGLVLGFGSRVRVSVRFVGHEPRRSRKAKPPYLIGPRSNRPPTL